VTHELQTNETLDVFKDEFREFEDEEVSLGNRLENNLEVFHSFAHFHYSKNKNVNAVQWMPVHHGPTLPPQGRGLGGASGTLVAFSCSNNVTFDQWVDNSGKVLTSSILIYSLADVLHPWLVLEVPGNVQTFKVHPTHPEYVAAGLATGQVIFWDLSDAREKVRQFQEQQRVNQHAFNRSGAGGKGATVAVGGGGGGGAPSGATGSGGAGDSGESSNDDVTTAIPPIKYTVLSYIDRSHSRPVSDLVWLPAHQQLNRKGEFYTADKGVSSQFASVASDGKLLIWDFKNKNDGAAAKASAAAAAAAMSSPAPGSLAARLAAAAEDPDSKEPRWAPIFSLPLARSDAGSGSSGSSSSSSGGIVTAVKLAVGEGNVLMCVTEDGEVVEADWTARATEERSKPDTIKSIQRAHFASAASVERSPHFSDIYLTVGDWTFSIWKVGIEFPVFTSSCASEYLTCGRWSPSRPGIIVTARSDGSLDVWDLVDQCHKASLNFQSGFSDALSSLEFWQSRSSSAQFLAAGDSGGKCHIIEVPRNLRRKIANEENLMRLFYEREIARSTYVRRRAEVRKARAAKEAQSKGKQVTIVTSDDPNNPAAAAAAGAGGAVVAAPPGSQAAAQQARDEKLAEAAAKEKADKLRQLEEEKAEKDFQRLFEQFKQSLTPDELGLAKSAADGATSASPTMQLRK
jgi:WD40 repeat protein